MAKCTGKRCPMQYWYKVEECNHADCPYRTEPRTNADRIRAMTDEELLGFLMRFQHEAEKRFAEFKAPNYNELAEWLSSLRNKKL